MGSSAIATSATSGIQEHKCTIAVPLGINTFLRPLPETMDFKTLWSGQGLKTVPSFSLPAPQVDADRCLSPSDLLKDCSEDAEASAFVQAAAATKAALCCGGALQIFSFSK